MCTDEHMNLSPFNYGGGLIVFVDKRCIIILLLYIAHTHTHTHRRQFAWIDPTRTLEWISRIINQSRLEMEEDQSNPKIKKKAKTKIKSNNSTHLATNQSVRITKSHRQYQIRTELISVCVFF